MRLVIYETFSRRPLRAVVGIHDDDDDDDDDLAEQPYNNFIVPP